MCFMSPQSERSLCEVGCNQIDFPNMFCQSSGTYGVKMTKTNLNTN